MPVNWGYEVEIGDWPDDYSCTGVLPQFTKALAGPIKPFGEWNMMEIAMDGAVNHRASERGESHGFLEGNQSLKYADSIDPNRGPRPDSGYIGLENHPDSPVNFKEVTLLPLAR